MASIPNKVNGDTLYATELFKFINNDATSSNTTSTSETKIAEVIISADELNTIGIYQAVVLITPEVADEFCTLRMRVGTNAAFASNTIVQSMEVGNKGPTTSTFDRSASTSTLLYIDSSSTFTGQIYVQITAQWDNAGASEARNKNLVITGV